MERRLQTCIEAALDLNGHLLVALGHPAPESGYQSFVELAAKTPVLEADLAADLASFLGTSKGPKRARFTTRLNCR